MVLIKWVQNIPSSKSRHFFRGHLQLPLYQIGHPYLGIKPLNSKHYTTYEDTASNFKTRIPHFLLGLCAA